jgi:FtsP/CotA-like multicopper oxidase with cupredoxin domain
MGHPFDDFEKNYVEAGPHKIGRIYKKAVYREYTDETFTKLKLRLPEEQYLGLLGPILRGEVGDTIKVVFKNNGARPYSMHPHGVFYQKDSEGSSYSDNSSSADKIGGAVPAGSTHTYTWKIPERAGPGPSDPSSIAWLYHSHCDEMRDVAAGLVGVIVVTSRGEAKPDGRPLDADREFVTLFVAFNENLSWYTDDNIKTYATDPGGVNKMEFNLGGPGGTGDAFIGTAFVNVNWRWSINGYLFGNQPMMTMSKGDRVRWYVGTIADFNNGHTPHWHGNTVLQRGRRVDVIDINAAEMDTVDMVPDDPGIWLYHCHFSEHMAAGMVTRYEVKP